MSLNKRQKVRDEMRRRLEEARNQRRIANNPTEEREQHTEPSVSSDQTTSANDNPPNTDPPNEEGVLLFKLKNPDNSDIKFGPFTEISFMSDNPDYTRRYLIDRDQLLVKKWAGWTQSIVNERLTSSIKTYKRYLFDKFLLTI